MRGGFLYGNMNALPTSSQHGVCEETLKEHRFIVYCIDQLRYGNPWWIFVTLTAVKHSFFVQLVRSEQKLCVSSVFYLWEFAEGDEPSGPVFLSSFCFFFCGSMLEPGASWSSLARFAGNAGRGKVNILVFSAPKQHCSQGLSRVYSNSGGSGLAPVRTAM